MCWWARAGHLVDVEGVVGKDGRERERPKHPGSARPVDLDPAVQHLQAVDKAVQSRGKAVNMQREVRERQWAGSGNTRKGSTISATTAVET